MRFILSLYIVFSVLSNSWSQDVFQACRSGNIEKLKELYQSSPDTLNAINDHGFSPLIIAIYTSNVECAKFLLKHGANVNYESPEGTAIVGACYKGNYEMVKLLIANGASVNVLGAQNISPLIFAVQSKNIDLVELLLKNDADCSIQDSAGRTALDYAQLMKLDDIAELFDKRK